MLKKKLLTPVIILFSVCLAVLGFVVFRNRGEFIPIENSTSLTAESVLNWQTYENIEYHLRFQYPPESSVKELLGLAPNFLQVNLLEKSQKVQAIIMVKGDYESKDVIDFVGAEPEEEININGQSWYFFNFPKGYSNSPPFTTYQNEKVGFLYSFKFYDLVTDELRDQIMATVQIAP